MTEQRKNAAVIDMDEALLCTAGDRDMLISMGQLFLEEGPRQLQAIHARIEAGDAGGIRDTAHTLKGSVVIFGARAVAAAALAVEQAATGSDLSGVPAAWDSLKGEMDRLLCAVEELCHE
jgi:HPt (histidine-containing phosphotransfer) domain-containing protein